MQDQQLKIILSAIDDTKKAFENVQKNLKATTKETDKTVTSFINFKTALLAIGTVITGVVINKVVRLTAEYEDLKTSLNLVSGSSEKGAEAFMMLSDLTRNSTLRVKDLADTYQILATSGVKPTRDLLETLQDTFSATGKRIEVLNQLTTLFAKGTQGGLGLMTIQNLIKQGIPVWDILEKRIGVTKDTFARFSETASGSQQILEALQIGLKETFGGATEQRSNDLSVSLARISKEFDKVFKTVGDGKLNDAFRDIADSLTKMNEEGKPFLEFLGSLLAFVIKSGSVVIDFFTGLAKRIEAVRNLPNEITDVGMEENIKKFNDELEKIKLDKKTFEESKIIIEEILDDIDGIVSKTKQQIELGDVLNGIYKQNEFEIKNIQNQWGSTKDIIKNVTDIMNKGIKDFSVGIAESIVLGKSLSDTFKAIAQKFLISILSTVIELIAREAILYFWKKLQTTEMANQLATAFSELKVLYDKLGVEKLITKEKEAQANAQKSGGGSPEGQIISYIVSSALGFAEGGAVSAGQPTMVGERGRELFIPSTSGQIVPNQDLTSGASLNFNISANDVRGIKELLIDNRAVIVNIVNQALNARGKASLV